MDPSVLVKTVAVSVIVKETETPATLANFFSFQPKKLMDAYLANKNNPDAWKALFDHMTNHACVAHWEKENIDCVG
jgi:hypothetical protein